MSELFSFPNPVNGPVPGPPKRLAHGMGAVMSTAALVLAFGVSHAAADAVLIAFIPAAGLVSIAGNLRGVQGVWDADAGRARAGVGVRGVR